MATDMNGLPSGWAEKISQNVLNTFGLNASGYKSVSGKSTQDWASQYTSQLSGLNGYYDQNQVNALMGSLGGVSSDTLNRQLQASIESANRLYTYTSNPGAAENFIKQQAASKNGGVLDFGGVGYATGRGSYDFMGNTYKDFSSGPLMSVLYDYTSAYRDAQSSIIGQIQQQTSRENSFISGINSLVRDATLKKTAAEQAAAQAALQKEQAAKQAALNASAQANQAKLTEQERKQNEQYAAAKAQADAAAAQQTKTLNETALLNVQKAVSASNAEQATVAQQQLEAQAGTVQGGEAIVSTNADETKQRAGMTRTNRWQSTRSPAAGGGGIRA